MFRLFQFFVGTLAVLFILNLASIAQTPSQSRAEDNYVTEKGFKSKVFDVKHRDVDSLSRVIRNLTSGFKGASVTSNAEFKTLTVRDFPENLATIEESLKRLDTPGTPPANIELRMHVLLASNSAAGKSASPPPAEIKDVVAQLGQTLNFRSYELAASIVQRITESDRGHIGKGSSRIWYTEGANNTKSEVDLPYQYEINGVSMTSTGGPSSISIRSFSFTTSLLNGGMRTQVNTALNIRDGEKVVVGTAAFGDRALIVVLTAKLVT